MGGTAAGSVRPRRPVRTAVVLYLVAGCTLAGCEYTYDDGARAGSSPSATAGNNVVLPPDPALEETVSGEELEEWATAALPQSQGQSFYSSTGYLNPGESKTEQTMQLPVGTYAVTLACRGTRRMSFAVKLAGNDLVDLTLGCANARVSVVQLDVDGALEITVGARSDANFAYRVSRL
ncbi:MULTISPECIES: hypothetical protein [unclassified Paenarthrobacter]|uniref:hypothetical protein n=1 Tax=unclassified Paenarthrobacter TaxID=2634190 RepID=UPI003CF92A56